MKIKGANSEAVMPRQSKRKAADQATVETVAPQSSGFAEQDQAQLAGSPMRSPVAQVSPSPKAHDGERRLLKLGPDGRILIPADVRKAMRLRDGDTLVASVTPNGELRLWGTDVGLDKLRALVTPYMPDGSAVDAFLGERRAMWGENQS
jgi:AbrB family looped-hinge helix DNA binding protein